MTRIKMGNDEFILFIRKNGVSTKTNTVLGKEIWNWIKNEDPGANIVKDSLPCRWGNTASHLAEDDLPKTATQFEFDIRILTDLYRFLLNL